MVVTHMASDVTTLMIQADFPTIPIATVFAYWTQPRLLERWWPQVAEVEAWEGGSYHLSWPSIQQDLRGQYVTFVSNERLVFTWQWDDDSEEQGERLVSLHFDINLDEGTILTLSHGPYGVTPSEQAIRTDHHLAGWLHFLPRLQEACTKGLQE